MGTRREEIQASIELVYRLAKRDNHDLLPDIEYSEAIVKDLLALSDALQAFLEAKDDYDRAAAKDAAWDLLCKHQMPILGKE